MNTNSTIIDVEPVEYSSTRAGRTVANDWPKSGYGYRPASGQSSSAYNGYAYRQAGGQNVSAYNGNQTAAMNTAESVFAGFAQIALGAGLFLVGIPMLILPGPGLLAMIGGMALASSGMRKVLG